MIPSLKSALIGCSVILCSMLVTASAEDSSKDIVGTAMAAGNLTTLVKAIQAADLQKVLQEKGPFTVFAPDDAAFAKIPANALDLILNNKPRLANLLKFHVVRANVSSREAARVGTVQTLEGDVLTIQPDGKNLKVEDATIIKADIPCKNGIIHIIDTVLQPSDKLQ